MKVFVTIFSILAALLILILLSTVQVDMRLDGEFSLAVKLDGLSLLHIPAKRKKEDRQKEEQPKEPEKESKPKKPDFFTVLKEKRGFSGAVLELLGFARGCLEKVRFLLKHIRIKELMLEVSVASDEAAKTALEYGEICAAAYPVLSMLNAVAGFDLKKISIRSDFESEKPQFRFSGSARLRILFLVIAAFGLLGEFLSFKKRNDL